jgi:hypothetical protein
MLNFIRTAGASLGREWTAVLVVHRDVLFRWTRSGARIGTQVTGSTANEEQRPRMTARHAPAEIGPGASSRRRLRSCPAPRLEQ